MQTAKRDGGERGERRGDGKEMRKINNLQVSNMDEVLALMTTGSSNRAVGTTNQNEHSSR
jgi:hypothetical protein